jgi:NAD(P)-dependent dehydrogenase (short-subunit alcohol dehydrogenase family)
MPKFNGKIALVTGGTSGIGLAAVSLLRAEGAEVIAVGTNPERLAAVREIVANNGLVLEVDLRKLANIDGVIEAVSQKYGKLDIVYANAGLGLAAPLEAVTEEQIDKQFGVNFKGLFFTVQKAVPLLVEGGSIVLTTS